jgi:hypothetical protein
MVQKVCLSWSCVDDLDTEVECPFPAEPGPTPNWQSRSPLIGPRRAAVDPLEPVALLNSGRSERK